MSPIAVHTPIKSVDKGEAKEQLQAVNLVNYVKVKSKGTSRPQKARALLKAEENEKVGC